MIIDGLKFYGAESVPKIKKYSFNLSIEQMELVKAIAYCRRKELREMIGYALNLLIEEGGDLSDIKARYASYMKRHEPKY